MQDEKFILEGIVIALKANYLLIEIDLSMIKTNSQANKKSSQNLRLLCTKRNRLNYSHSFISVGDFVLVEEINLRESSGVVCGVKPRLSFLSRPPVANISHIFVVVSIDQPKIVDDQINRFLLSAEHTLKNVSVILTKQDLIEFKELNVHVARFKEWGYDSYPVSIKTGYGVRVLKNKLSTVKLGVLCGPSGTGKSSLLNYLRPQSSIPVNTLSKKLNRGRHTTRHVELFSVGNNTLIADTPGFNRPELSVDPKELSLLFPELRKQLINQSCKFRDCLHLEEPGCAVDKNWERYSHYKLLLQSIVSLRRQSQEY